MQRVPFIDGAKIGLGFDRLSGDVMPTAAVTGRGVSANALAIGEQVTADCTLTEDVGTLHRSLGVSVDAGGSYFGFKGGAKVDYLNTCDFSSFSSYVCIKVSVQCATETIDEPIFSPDANELLVVNNPVRFRQRYADTFISGIKKGGEFFAIYQVTGSNAAERESVATKIRAAYDAGPLSPVSAHLDTAVTAETASSSSHLAVQCHVFRQGTVGTTDMNLADIMKTAKEFPVGVSGDKAFPYEIILQEYSALKSPNDKFDYIQIQNRQNVLADLAKKRFEFLALRDDLRYIAKHMVDFENADRTPVNKDALGKDLDEIVNAINTMEKEASLCTRDATKCDFSKFDTAKFNVPVLTKNSNDKAVDQGEAMVNQDSMAVELRNSLPDGPSKVGFNMAFGMAGTQTLPGPGKDKFRDENLQATQRIGWNTATSYFLDRNRNADLVKRGVGVAASSPVVMAARIANSSSVLFRLGFDIATGIFGDPNLGAHGNTATGTGAQKIHADLASTDAKRGFDASMKLHLGPPPLKRGI
jgi:hypothetical protein